MSTLESLYKSEKEIRNLRSGQDNSAALGLVNFPITPHLQFHHIGDQQILLVSEFFNTLLHGKLYCDLIPLLTGNRTLDSIVSTLDSEHNFTNLLTAVATLSTQGYVVSAEYRLEPAAAAYWTSLGASPRCSSKDLRKQVNRLLVIKVSWYGV